MTDPTNRLRLLREQEVAELLDVPRATLATWRSRWSDRLPFIRLGRSIRYRPQDVEAYLAAQTRRSTSDAGEAAG